MFTQLHSKQKKGCPTMSFTNRGSWAADKNRIQSCERVLIVSIFHISEKQKLLKMSTRTVLLKRRHTSTWLPVREHLAAGTSSVRKWVCWVLFTLTRACFHTVATFPRNQRYGPIKRVAKIKFETAGAPTLEVISKKKKSHHLFPSPFCVIFGRNRH